MNYKIKKNQIKAALGFQVNLAQMKLEDGITVIEAESFEPEFSVGIVTADGVIPMPIGEYTLEDGKVLVVEVEGIISSINDQEAEVEVEVEVAPEQVASPEMQATPAAPAPQAKRIVESVSKETFFAEMEKLRLEFASQIEELKGKKDLIVEKEEEKIELSDVSVNPIVHNPEAEQKIDMTLFGQNRAETIQDKVFERMFN